MRTFLKFFEQVLYLSYCLSYLHQTCMDGALYDTYALDRLNAESEPLVLDAGGG